MSTAVKGRNGVVAGQSNGQAPTVGEGKKKVARLSGAEVRLLERGKSGEGVPLTEVIDGSDFELAGAFGMLGKKKFITLDNGVIRTTSAGGEALKGQKELGTGDAIEDRVARLKERIAKGGLTVYTDREYATDEAIDKARLAVIEARIEYNELVLSRYPTNLGQHEKVERFKKEKEEIEARIKNGAPVGA